MVNCFLTLLEGIHGHPTGTLAVKYKKQSYDIEFDIKKNMDFAIEQ